MPLNKRFKTGLKIQIETRKIERGIAGMPLVLLWSYLMMGDDWGSATDSDRLLASSGRSTPFFKDDFRSRHTDLRPKRSPKNDHFEFCWILDISARSSRILKLFGPGYMPPLCHGHSLQFSNPSL